MYTFGSGGLSIDWTGAYTTGASVPVRPAIGASNVKYYINGTLKATLSAIQPGGVAFGGDKPKFDNLKIGYDNNGDDDIDDAGDDLVINETFSSTSKTVGYDHAGNLIDDGNF